MAISAAVRAHPMQKPERSSIRQTPVQGLLGVAVSSLMRSSPSCTRED